jgi:hypothetical protein
MGRLLSPNCSRNSAIGNVCEPNLCFMLAIPWKHISRTVWEVHATHPASSCLVKADRNSKGFDHSASAKVRVSIAEGENEGFRAWWK